MKQVHEYRAHPRLQITEEGLGDSCALGTLPACGPTPLKSWSLVGIAGPSPAHFHLSVLKIPLVM